MTFLLGFIGVLMVGGAAGLAVRAVALPRWRMLQRLDDIAGYGLVQLVPADATDDGGRPGGVHRLASLVGAQVAKHSGAIDLAQTRKRLLAAGFYRARADAFQGYRVLATLVLGALGLAGDLGTPMGVALAIILVAVGWFGPPLALQRLAFFRGQKIEDTLPDLVDILVVTVEAGLSFSGSLKTAVARMDGPLAEELSLALQEQRMGLPITDALSNMLQRSDGPSMRALVQAVTQAETLGVSIGEVLRSLAVDMRKRRRARAEERAQKAPIKMLFPLVFLIFPAMFVVILAPGFMQLLEALKSVT
jgi:tight adherence protein C